MLRNILDGADADVDVSYGVVRPSDNVLIVALTSDRGLSGAFNSNIVRLTKATIEQKYAAQRAAGKVTVLTVGKKGFEALRKDRQLKVIDTYVDLFTRLSFEDASKAAEEVMSGFGNKQYDVVEVIYNQFRNQITQIPTVEQFLPIEKLDDSVAPATGTTAAKIIKGYRPVFIYQPDQKEIIEELLPKILKTRFFRFLLDSNASEHGARMTAMDNATNNAEELLKNLKIDYNRVRQAAITTELTEIVSGAAALQG